MNLVLNNLQWMMCYKPKPNQTKSKMQPLLVGLRIRRLYLMQKDKTPALHCI